MTLSLLHCVQSYHTVSNLTTLCTILPHWGLEGGGMGPETAHVHKITYGPLIDTALYVICLMVANPLLWPLEGLGHWKVWAMKVSTFLGLNNSRFARAVSGPKKVSTFMVQPYTMALVMDLPPSNKLVTGPYKS